ncbi:MAG: diaminopimelate dehydrogenase [Oscillospiraceae bacterium]
MIINVAIVGYGNIGKYLVDAIKHHENINLVGVIRRKESLKETQVESEILFVDDVNKLPIKPDIAILATPTRAIEEEALKYIKMGINTIDSFDIHTDIYDLKEKLDIECKENNVATIISAGWDPGIDSMVRCIMEFSAPCGITYTNFGLGMSMGHSTAVKSMDFVNDALSLTVPMGQGIHRRLVYVELEDGVNFEDVEQNIKKDDYFKNDETYVFKTDNINSIKDMGHGVNMVRKGVSSSSHNQLFEFNMKINNPGLTAQIMVASCIAVLKQKSGAYTMIEIAPIDFLDMDKKTAIKKMV